MSERNRILVEMTLRSGGKHVFEITEYILEDLEHFQNQGLSAQELCESWLALTPRDPPTLLRVFGKRADGRDVLIELRCAHARESSKSARQGNGTR